MQSFKPSHVKSGAKSLSSWNWPRTVQLFFLIGNTHQKHHAGTGGSGSKIESAPTEMTSLPCLCVAGRGWRWFQCFSRGALPARDARRSVRLPRLFFSPLAHRVLKLRSSATQQPCTGYRRLSASSRLLWPTPFPLVSLVDPSTVCQPPEGCEESLDAVQYSQRKGSKDSNNKKCLPFPPPGKERKHTTNIFKISWRRKAH